MAWSRYFLPMNGYVFPGPDPQFEPCERPDAVIAKLRKAMPLDSGEAKEFLDWLVYGARQQMNLLVKSNYSYAALASGETPDINNEDLQGYCGFAQCLISFALDDLRIPHRELAIQSIPDRQYWHAHVATILTFKIGEEEATFLLDSTFKQFCNPQRSADSHDVPYPGFELINMQHGDGIVDKLLIDGWIELSSAIAAKYLAAFNKGQPCFKDAGGAFNFMKNPPPHEDNNYFKRNEMGLFCIHIPVM